MDLRNKDKAGTIKHAKFLQLFYYQPFQDNASIVDPLCYLCYLCYLCFVFVFVILSCLRLACRERADLLDLLCVMFSCVIVTSHTLSWIKCGT